jgi:hypothetical protein
MRRSNNRLIANSPSLLIDNSIRITTSLGTIEITIVIVTEAEIVIITVITTIIATRIPISPAIVIVIRIPRSRTLYIRD